MLLAYIDEIGEPGAFVSKDHARFKTSPAFGYAGYIIEEAQARDFGRLFTREKRTVFKREIGEVANPGRWEAKGASMFRATTPQKHPALLRVMRGLVTELSQRGGKIFYFAQEKPIGTERQTRQIESSNTRELNALLETINRICTHADKSGEQVLIMIDQINEKTRHTRVAECYAHVFARSGERPEMRRLVEPPMHIDSELSSNIQFADWVAAAVSRGVDRQLIEHSDFMWVGHWWGRHFSGSFTHESTLRLWQRSIENIHNRQLFHRERPLYPTVEGYRLSSAMPPGVVQRIKAASEANHRDDH